MCVALGQGLGGAGGGRRGDGMHEPPPPARPGCPPPHTHTHTHRVPQGLEETAAEDTVARPLFLTRHGRANTLVT